MRDEPDAARERSCSSVGGAAKTGPAAVAARCPGDPVWSRAATRRDHVPELIWCVHKCVPVIRRHHHHQLSPRLRGDVREDCGMSRMRLENGIACPTRAPAPGSNQSEIGELCSRFRSRPAARAPVPPGVGREGDGNLAEEVHPSLSGAPPTPRHRPRGVRRLRSGRSLPGVRRLSVAIRRAAEASTVPR